MQSKPPSHFLNYALPKLEDVLFIAVLGMCFFLGARMLSIDSDVGRHITLGSYILEEKYIPTQDILSHTKLGESRPPYEWLSQLFFAIAHNFAGLDSVILLTSIIISITFFLIYKESEKRSRAPILSIFLTILGVAVSSVHWLPRPHVITFLMLFIWVQQLESLRKDEKQKLWKFPLIMILWANLHGGFIFGFLAWFAYMAGAIWEEITKNNKTNLLRLLSVGAFSLIASILTPDGWGSWHAVLSNNSQYILQNTAETMSPDFYQKGMMPFLLLLGLTIAIPALTNTQLHAGQVFLLSGMAMASLLVARNIPLFTVVAIPVLSECIQPNKFPSFLENLENRVYSMQSRLRSYWSVIVSIGLIIFISMNYSNRQSSIMQFNEAVFPVQAVEWLKENPQTGNMFNEFNWGGYIEYRLFPSQKVFLDSQTDFYGEVLIREYVQITSAQAGWENSLEKYQVEWVIINPNSPLANLLASDSDWQLLYQDKVAAIYSKSK